MLENLEVRHCQTIGRRAGGWAILLVFTVSSSVVLAQGQEMMRSRVPADQLAEARALTNPLPASPGAIEQGKALYKGKGTCLNCHGAEGAGNGPVAAQLSPSPRNFQHHGFWRHRTEGELFWVIKHGSPGTSMIGFGGQLTDEEIWALIQYERTFSRQPGPQAGMGSSGPMGHRGPGGGMGQGRMGQSDQSEIDVPSREAPESASKAE